MEGFGDIKKNKKLAKKNGKEKLLEVALDYHSKGNISKALDCYEQIIKDGIEDPRVYSGLGLIALQKLNIDEALKHNIKSISIAPYYSPAYSNIGVILIKKGNLLEAEKYIRKAILLDRNSVSAHLNLADLFYRKTEFKEAEKYIRKAISLQSNNIDSYYLLSKILRNSCNYRNAELALIKAIKIDKNKADSYCLLAEIYKECGSLDKARENLHKAIKLNSQFANAFYSLSTLKNSNEDDFLNKNLFAIDLDKIASIKDKIDLCFAKANVLHEKGVFNESSRYLKEANNYKLSLYPSSANQLIKKSKENFTKSETFFVKDEELKKNKEQCIFIVGMPRSGSTLLETILCANKNVVDLGERPLVENLLKVLFSDSNNPISKNKFYELYLNERRKFNKNKIISTDKYLYNYLYLGYILGSMPFAKVIHIFRHPLDNILSIYRANFGEGIRFASSVKDCARVYIDQDEIINQYKIKFPSQIYSLNYDLMVTNSESEIRKLILWLNWDWDNAYLDPHKVNRQVKTASVIQVRSPINTKSLGGWRNYLDILTPAMEIIKDYSLPFDISI